MIDPNPEVRPSAIGLLQHRVLSLSGNMSQAQLHTQLNAEKLKTEILAMPRSAPSVIQQCTDNVVDLAEDKPPLSAWISWLVGMVKQRLSRASV
jgi:hypothetical protein